ncbi:MAG: tRNA (adenosine(37)-N6)-threonylcarbamoyltransferase complex dimerization subunit type 1 TsaB [Rhodobacteraceae bacterium]|nr:tRNA (adenosine(37)-N6)-threonylcarbamoyltransferase complex dimerization subunit type 1 TsaB [Paracoccaceae bacterium]
MRPDAPVLAFDTSAAHCAAALLRGGEILAERAEPMERGQAERLMPMLAGMLAGQGLAWRDLGLIAVGTGPGNFTGVRLAVAAARGLAMSLGVPAVGVTALEAAAYGLPRPVLAALDARRGEVFLQLFDGAESPPPALARDDALPSWAFSAGAVAGDAAPRLAPVLGAVALAQPVPLAVAIGRLAALAAGAGAPPGRPAPLYLRAADAAPRREAPPELLP